VAELNADPAWRALLAEPFEVRGFERAAPEGSTLRVVARAHNTDAAARLAREARLRVLQRWNEAGIRTAAEPWPRAARATPDVPPPVANA
jgi:hypothetical protein